MHACSSLVISTVFMLHTSFTLFIPWMRFQQTHKRLYLLPSIFYLYFRSSRLPPSLPLSLRIMYLYKPIYIYSSHSSRLPLNRPLPQYRHPSCCNPFSLSLSISCQWSPWAPSGEYRRVGSQVQRIASQLPSSVDDHLSAARTTMTRLTVQCTMYIHPASSKWFHMIKHWSTPIVSNYNNHLSVCYIQYNTPSFTSILFYSTLLSLIVLL